MIRDAAPPDWLETRAILNLFGQAEGQAIASYRDFIAAGTGEPSPWGNLKRQGFLGYTQEAWEKLERDLRALAAADAEFTEQTGYGRKYEIRGTITEPNGKTAAIATEWIVPNDESVARFVTAYPGTQR